ncbi:Uncharacterised protein [Providencia rettgeri]|uniref:DUF3742 family protein n=2 Tax=Morganellaceae TaxID=1903414 RepID=A0A9N8CYD7_PRORE|nr:Uncharacterised protein [Providencia rettgeri]CAB5689123.1 Uncharacterised protein [Providencia rettgeri]CAC9188940.1 Uncharacterised protein [Providencia rettgeri]CAC9224557.1 Uncharacterised protein [Providencia rettgeri]BBV00381.1 hypothetical protein BML2526_20330 [Providencia rettgeri]
MTNKIPLSRGERWGMKAAAGTKWLIRRLKMFDKRYVAKAKGKNWPDWVGHLPIALVLILLLIAFLASIGFLIVFLIAALLMIVFEFIYCRPTPVTITNWEDEQSHRKYHSDGSNGSDGSSGS